MKQPIFRDKARSEFFEREGYAVINFCDEAIIAKLASIFYQQHLTIPQGFWADATNPDDIAKRESFEKIDELLHDSLEKNFIDYQKLGAAYLCKAADDKGLVNVHQDWSVVDETRFTSATIWIPLQAVDETNGALRVLPRSHLFFDYYRSNNIPVCYRGSEQLLWDQMITIPMKCGEAIIINHAIIHASGLNRSNSERVVLAYGIVSDGTGLRYYHREKNSPNEDVEVYDMPEDFFLKYHNIGNRPVIGTRIKTITHLVPAKTIAEIRALFPKIIILIILAQFLHLPV